MNTHTIKLDNFSSREELKEAISVLFKTKPSLQRIIIEFSPFGCMAAERYMAVEREYVENNSISTLDRMG